MSSEALERADALLAHNAENVQSATWWFAEARAAARDVRKLAAEVARLEQKRDIAKEQHANTLNRMLDERADLAAARARLATYEYERDAVGPFFVRDMARIAGLPDDANMAAIADALAAARAREQRLAQAMARIVANAEDWHGYLPPDNAPGAGHVRALGVIAQWGRAALAAEPAADEGEQ